MPEMIGFPRLHSPLTIQFQQIMFCFQQNPNKFKNGSQLTYNQLSSRRMGCKQKLKDLFLKCDIFATSEFLRYNDEPEYRTMTGAFCSVATVVTFGAIFMSVMINTFEKTEIIWSLNTVDVPIDEFMLTASIQGTNKFMFAVQISGEDLNNNTDKKFDINFTLRKRENTVITRYQKIALEKCTLQHWNINEQFVRIFHRIGFEKMLCPKIGQQIPMQGKFTSELFQYAEIEVVKCSTDNTTKTCANESSLQGITFHYNVYMLNTLINPGSPQYITYYLEDRNYITYTTSYSCTVSIFISDYEITTDQSITPIKSQKVETGGMINSLGQVVPFQVTDQVIASFVFRRASTTTMVNRAFKRVDETFSYIGGLFGFVLIVLLFMKEYTEYSFEIDASSHLYYHDSDKPIPSQKFNILIFMGYIVYLLLDGIGLKPDWKTMEAVDESREEIQKQLDVRFLFERINFVQKALSHLFSDNQSKFLHLHRKATLKEATKLRQGYKLRRAIIRNGADNEITESQLDNTSQKVEIPQEVFFNNETDAQNLGVNEINGENELISGKKKEDVLKSMKDNYRQLHKDTFQGNHVSRKIIEELDPKIIKIINKTEISDDYEERNQDYSVQKMKETYRKNGEEFILPNQTRINGKGSSQLVRIQQDWQGSVKISPKIEHTFEFIT